jgi:hypothetical protein
VARIASFALTNDGRRAALLSTGEIWSEQNEVREGRFWRELPRTGLPEGAVVREFAVDGTGKVTALLSSGELFETHREAHERGMRWRPVDTAGLP